MVKIRINLATKAYPRRDLGYALPIIVMLAGGVAMSWQISEYKERVLASRRLEEKVTEYKAKAVKKTEYATIRISPGQAEVASNIMTHRSFSWIDALDNIEKALPPEGVMLSSINPSVKDGGVGLSGSARSFASISEFIIGLEDLKVYKKVFLSGHTSRKGEDGREIVTFSISIVGGR